MIKKPLKRGFTLIEMAIVITILGLIMYSTLKFGSAALEATKVSTTKEKLEKIQDALQLYVEMNGELPCPAAGNAAVGAAAFGVAATLAANACTDTGAGMLDGTDVFVGVVPTVTLGLPSSYMYDGWGKRITYVVDEDCENSDVWAATGCDNADLLVEDNAAADGNNISNAVAYVLISHGKMGPGGWDGAGNRTFAAASDANFQSTYEADNGSYNSGAGTESIDTDFRDAAINDGNYDSGDAGTIYDNYFDDIVVWKTENMIWFDACDHNAAWSGC